MAVDPNIKKKADDIRNKVYGKEVRESLASGLEEMSSDVVENTGRQSVVEDRQDSVESQWQSVIDETTNLDVVSAPEIIAARNGEANLKARLDKDKNEVAAQLARADDYLNQLQNIILHGELTPYFIENLATFSWNGSTVPENLAPYSGGNYHLKIKGNKGDDFVTVIGGDNIADAGQTKDWTAVIKDDNGIYETYMVSGTDGSDKVFIFPELKKDITNGEIGNLHDVQNGQHMTSRGTQAFAQHVYHSIPKYADRNLYIEKYSPVIDSIHSWEKFGRSYANYRGTANIMQGGYLQGNRTNGAHVTTYAEELTGGIEWQVDLKSHDGFLETFVSGSDGNGTVTVEYYLDDLLEETVAIETQKVTRLLFDFGKENLTGKIRVFIENSTELQKFRVYDTTWWVNSKKHSNKIIPPHSKVVTLMDSWGTFHDHEFSKHLSELISQDSGTTVDVIDHSQAGTTSARGLAWFNEYVIKENPTHVIISYFTNDVNSVSNDNSYNYVGPDGETHSGKLTSKDDWIENIDDMIRLAISRGIQPIIMQPSSTASLSQTQTFSNWDAHLTYGEKI